MVNQSIRAKFTVSQSNQHMEHPSLNTASQLTANKLKVTNNQFQKLSMKKRRHLIK